MTLKKSQSSGPEADTLILGLGRDRTGRAKSKIPFSKESPPQKAPPTVLKSPLLSLPRRL